MNREISFPRTIFLNFNPAGLLLVFFNPFGFFFIPLPYPNRTLCRLGPSTSGEPMKPALSDVPVISNSYPDKSSEMSSPLIVSPIELPTNFSSSVSTLNVFPLYATFILNAILFKFPEGFRRGGLSSAYNCNVR